MAQRTDIISETAIAFMRTIDLAFSISNAKPNTKLYAFFDGISVDAFITQTGGVKGVSVVTNSSGSQTGIFTINDFTYSTGTKLLKFQDTPNFSQNSIPGSTVSSAESSFTSVGVLRTTQDTIATVNTVYEPIIINKDIIGGIGDPLAQSFFTYGVKGGVNISKIDIFFQSKEDDGAVPVTLEIRELVNGLPSLKLASYFSRVVIAPENISTSLDASAPTSFVFDTPVFLPESRDWCFVLISNSDKYNVWIAKIGEKSRETGLTIYEQPYIGNIFKSQNNITWSPDPTEDIKFVIYQAVFSNSGGATVTLRAKPKKLLIYGKNMSVVSGLNTINITTNHFHGLRNGDKVRLLAPVGSTALGYSTYRGISDSQLSGLYTATYIDEHNITVQLASGSFSSTGTLETPGIVNVIQIDSGGTGYTTTPTISIIGANTTPALATLQTTNGVITGVTITDHGSGYLVKPTIIINGNGVGASLFLICETVIQIETNRVFDEALPRIANYAPALTSVVATLKTTSANYDVQDPIGIKLNITSPIPKKSLILSSDNGTAFLPGQNATELVISLGSDNTNLSPLISLSETPTLECRAYVINDQTSFETINPSITSGSGSLNSVFVTSGGSGYSSNAVTISSPNISSGVLATAFATLTGGVVTSVTVTNGGSGYTSPPVATMTQTLSTAAVLTPTLSSFNTEILPTGGSAKSRYVTKPISLATISTGSVVYVNAFSTIASNFDLYIRTSLRADNTTHTTGNWKMFSCDVLRNKSTKLGEFLDYAFYINNLNPFDVYDLKIVLRSSDKRNIPIIKNYRAIILAT